MASGVEQSQAHANAARELSAARAATKMGLPNTDQLLSVAEAKYRKALQEYIDPNKVYRTW